MGYSVIGRLGRRFGGGGRCISYVLDAQYCLMFRCLEWHQHGGGEGRSIE